MADWDDHDIGYGKPPKWSRFRKGKSGNPKGRPKKKKAPKLNLEPESELDEIQRRVLDKQIQVTEAGERRVMKMVEVIAQAQASKAAKGHVLAQRDILKRAEDLERREKRRA